MSSALVSINHQYEMVVVLMFSFLVNLQIPPTLGTGQQVRHYVLDDVPLLIKDDPIELTTHKANIEEARGETPQTKFTG